MLCHSHGFVVDSSSFAGPVDEALGAQDIRCRQFLAQQKQPRVLKNNNV